MKSGTLKVKEFLQTANNEVILLETANPSIETGQITLTNRLHCV